jgi:hypothetical protein
MALTRAAPQGRFPEERDTDPDLGPGSGNWEVISPMGLTSFWEGSLLLRRERNKGGYVNGSRSGSLAVPLLGLQVRPAGSTPRLDMAPQRHGAGTTLPKLSTADAASGRRRRRGRPRGALGIGADSPLVGAI